MLTKALQNISQAPDLRKKILWTLGILILVRVGVFVPIPGVNTLAIKEAIETISTDAMRTVAALLDMFSGGGLSNASIFALGVMPYISASIVFQILTAMVPALKRLQKEGESGRKRIAQYTRYAAVGLCLIQGLLLSNQILNMKVGDTAKTMQADWVSSPVMFRFIATIMMTSGTMLLMWMGEQIDEFGIGNGVSLIIMISIVSRLPKGFSAMAKNFEADIAASSANAIGMDTIVMLIVIFVLMTVAVVVLQQATRKIKVQTTRRSKSGFKVGSFIPLKLNAAGVMAIIFAQALMSLPQMLMMLDNFYISVILQFLMPGAWLYETVYILLIFFFSYFYMQIIFDPVEQANNLKQQNVFIRGVRPGQETAEYLRKVIDRLTFSGAVFISVIALAPQFIQSQMSIDYSIAGMFGGTGLLIVVGVALDLVQRVENHLLSQRYDAYMSKSKHRIKTGRERGGIGGTSR
ncbi:MAG: preprotein translocase subunit SecY [Planctomycetota bacterium]